MLLDPGRYKGADGFGPIGRWIATADSVPDPHELTVSCVHQGRLVTSDSTANCSPTCADTRDSRRRGLDLGFPE